MSKYKIVIASVPDRDKLVAEIWFEQILIAEVNQENDQLEIELFSSGKKVINLDEFIRELEVAKQAVHA